MKKTFLYLALASIALTSCRKEEDGQRELEVSIETQNTYDDQAATKYLETHYFDSKGNVQELLSSDVTNVKLSALNPVTLPSGVVYVKRPNQPSPGTSIGNTDIIKLMGVTTTFKAAPLDSKIIYSSPVLFRNTIGGFGIPENDPIYFYTKKSILANATSEVAKQRSFYEIEGFKEAIINFKAYDIEDENDYNLQGLIIVPSRAAFARDPHFNYNNSSLNNKTFIFNFQVYKTKARPANLE